MKKMTKAEMYDVIMNAVNTGAWTVDTQEVIAFCEKEKAQIAKKAEKAKETAAKKRAEAVDELAEAVLSTMTDEFQTISQVLAQIEGEDLTAAKIAARMRKLVNAGSVEKEEVTVEVEGKKVKRMAYRLASTPIAIEF